MNFLLENWYLIVLALVSGSMLAWPTLSGGGGAGLTPTQAVQLINREKAVVVDVCEPAEYAAGHVSGARSVPLSQFKERLPQVVKNKGVPLVLVCERGMRARRATAMARQLGYDKAQTLAGGTRAWREANMPIEKA
ncbi:rhodanese-like domain-containing protein [Comamonas sp. NLF-1-9]|uniref:rhodanese-like domain-containing protein n=1 Tax=Comamonas sp. NLF-1-9 TaxID=2853163 RepID=UPI001C4958B0|nr:rhodanese-like domain-containing protein [Comamonas sp. NLF-1-9]QXL83139.1 rhodanese-like domain-containing protein [Comamonas sp. NLF-1-9]